MELKLLGSFHFSFANYVLVLAESGDSDEEYQPSKLGKRKLKIKPGTKSKLQKLDIWFV